MLAVWVGLLAARALPIPSAAIPAFTVALAVAALAAAFLTTRAWHALPQILAVTCAFALAGASRGLAARAVLETARQRVAAHEMFWIEGLAAEPSALESGSPLTVVTVAAAEPRLVSGSRLRLRFPAGTQVEWGDRVRMLARLSAAEPVRNPGGSDGRTFADANDLTAQGAVLFADVSPPSGIGALPRATVMRWRRAIESRLHARLSPTAVELVAPLMFGDRTAVDLDLDAAFRAAGLTHLLALSGMHVAWLATLARLVAAACGAGVRGRALTRGACAALYVLLAGPIPSLVRSAAQEVLAAGARLAQRGIDPLQALAVGALALLVAFPGWAHDLGFQLSCVATLGLVTLGGISASRGRVRWALALVVPTLAAQCLSLPILLSRFHALPWSAVITNLVAIPITGLLLTTAWLGTLLEIASPGSGTLLLDAAEPLAAALRFVVETALRWPGALIPTGDQPAACLLAAIGAALLAVARIPPRTLVARAELPGGARVVSALAGATLFATALLLAVTARPLRPSPGRFWLVMLDVGQGDAIALGFADGWWLVDAGPRSPRFDAGQSIVLPFLRWAGVRRVETLALTHDDGDHVGGAPALIRALPISRVIAPAPRSGVPGPLARFAGEAVARGAKIHEAPQVIVLWPPPPDSCRAFWERPVTSADNGAALVLELGRGRGRAVLAADADSAVELALGVAPGCALLKVAHHGSASSSGARFLITLRPAVAAISVGRRNRFGHPAPAALARIAASGARIERTDSSGALWFELTDAGMRTLEWRGAAGLRESQPEASPSRVPRLRE